MIIILMMMMMTMAILAEIFHQFNHSSIHYIHLPTFNSGCVICAFLYRKPVGRMKRSNFGAFLEASHKKGTDMRYGRESYDN